MRATSSVGLILAGLAVAGAISVPAAAQQNARRNDVITREEIQRVQVEDAYQVVLRLRPEFLHRAAQGKARLPGSDGQAGAPVGSVAPGTAAPETQRAIDPHAPEFDQGGTGTRVSPTSDGPAGFASPTTSGAAPSTAAQPASGPGNAVVVYVGNAFAGGIEELTTLPAALVKEIRYLRPAEAQFRFGPRHRGAAIILVTLDE